MTLKNFVAQAEKFAQLPDNEKAIFLRMINHTEVDKADIFVVRDFLDEMLVVIEQDLQLIDEVEKVLMQYPV